METILLKLRVGGKKEAGALFRYVSFKAAAHIRKPQSAAKPDVYWFQRTPVDFYSFDQEYLRRLGAHDAATEAHFVAYFSERLRITLRARGVDASTIEDVRQETFCRVWVAIQSGSVNNPRGFGAFVYSVCKHVLSESRRGDYRHQHDSLESTDVVDGQIGLEELLQHRENGNRVRAVLAELPERDRHLLQARFFEDRDNEEVCNDFGVDRDYLRVLFHRAINRFGDLYKKKSN
ncbi:MAG: polymerase sigma factor, sigma-70 family [Candidatus Angelobacter sp.]|nr:polymerase sigma factor, sigma-70 family [Candidatus Angelobacter sp.]